MTRKIPTTMASQHPDHAGKPYWNKKEFISTRKEVQECFLTFSELGISEYKWDWEGKFVDESVVDRLLSEHYEYFQKHPLGREKFLTFRLPNPKVETEFRLGRAFMGILGAAGLTKQLTLPTPPLFEVIVPMVESASEMIAIEEAFHEIANLKHALYNFHEGILKHIEVIPLFEKTDTIMHSDRILKEYLVFHKKAFGTKPVSMRPYVARSDPALNSGLVPTVLAIKIALSRYTSFAKEHEVSLYPIIGSACLPFRGGLTPYTVKEFSEEYAGVRTALLQSAFRYDYPLRDVIAAVGELDTLLPKGQAKHVSKEEEAGLEKLMRPFERHYRKTIEAIAPFINDVALFIPKRRERVQHVGLFGYSRGIGAVKLPRAITFTGSLYSLGVPPELIGAGRGLSEAKKQGTIALIEKYYLHLKADLRRAGRFFHRDALEMLQMQSAAWEDINEDIQGIESYLGEELGPKTSEEKEHAALVSVIVTNRENLSAMTEQLHAAALLRKSMG
ncbi:phosphoenolpyruvate carboxylase [Candidatus Gottesmanbacteria bacterium]|nr:phosphoenolpyruvate carboxylase [Candidatus Gottesmanbacteria bacterium]